MNKILTTLVLCFGLHSFAFGIANNDIVFAQRLEKSLDNEQQFYDENVSPLFSDEEISMITMRYNALPYLFYFQTLQLIVENAHSLLDYTNFLDAQQKALLQKDTDFYALSTKLGINKICGNLFSYIKKNTPQIWIKLQDYAKLLQDTAAQNPENVSEKTIENIEQKQAELGTLFFEPGYPYLLICDGCDYEFVYNVLTQNFSTEQMLEAQDWYADFVNQVVKNMHLQAWTYQMIYESCSFIQEDVYLQKWMNFYKKYNASHTMNADQKAILIMAVHEILWNAVFISEIETPQQARIRFGL